MKTRARNSALVMALPPELRPPEHIELHSFEDAIAYLNTHRPGWEEAIAPMLGGILSQYASVAAECRVAAHKAAKDGHSIERAKAIALMPAIRTFLSLNGWSWYAK